MTILINDNILYQLCLYTFSIMKRARQLECNKLGITSRNVAVLISIMRLGEEATLVNLSKNLVLEMQTVSAQLTRMEKDGLIIKEKDAKKRNLMHIRVTEKGYEYSLKGLKRESIKQVSSVLTNEEKYDLWLILSKLREQSMRALGKETKDLFPPSNPENLPSTMERERAIENSLLNKTE
jgi:DNA-binding MarR family transcriptional regulator